MRSKDFLYEEVYSDIRQKIMSGHYQPDDRLPGEDELSQEYHASRITIKRALDMLREDGLVRRVQGKGTFVMGLEDMRPAAPMEQRKESRLVGIVLEHVSSPFGLEMMYRMIRLLEEQNYKTCVRFTFGDIRKETEEINDLLSMHICGLIIMPCHDSYYNMTILKLILEHFPVVLVDKQMSGLPVSSIYTDGSGAVKALVHKLRERGAKNAALITIDPSSASSLGDRVEGFYKGLEETGIGNMGELILPRRTGDWIFEKRSENYITAIEGFLRSMDPLPEGIVCTEYSTARALLETSRQMHLELGVDTLACCIDENPNSTAEVFFSHMHQDEAEIARKAVEVLLTLLRNGQVSQMQIKVPAIYIEGRSL